jgi:hypoxanthine phosphoribosyltransferase
MGIITLHDKKFQNYIPEEAIQQRIKELASDLKKEVGNDEPLFLGILNGSFVFASDLIRELDFPMTISFVKVASYLGTKSSGSVSQLIGLNESILNKTVVVVEDIVDTGKTIEKIDGLLKNSGAKKIIYVTLLFKPEAYTKTIPIDHKAFEIPNEFVVGYGLDYNGWGRNIKSIYKIVEE